MSRFGAGTVVDSSGLIRHPGELAPTDWMVESIDALNAADTAKSNAQRTVDVARAQCYASFAVAAALQESAMLMREDIGALGKEMGR